MADKKTWRDYAETVLIAIFLALFIRSYVLTAYVVPTRSMAPTLLSGDYIFAYRVPFGFKLPLMDTKIGGKLPNQDSIVIFKYPENPNTTYVKRVVGLPGDVIQIKNKVLLVNEAPIRELSLMDSSIKVEDFGPVVVNPNEVFLLGDNVEISDDSRYWGSVPIDHIEAQVLFIWFSVDKPNSKLRWDRVFKSVN